MWRETINIFEFCKTFSNNYVFLGFFHVKLMFFTLNTIFIIIFRKMKNCVRGLSEIYFFPNPGYLFSPKRRICMHVLSEYHVSHLFKFVLEVLFLTMFILDKTSKKTLYIQYFTFFKLVDFNICFRTKAAKRQIMIRATIKGFWLKLLVWLCGGCQKKRFSGGVQTNLANFLRKY